MSCSVRLPRHEQSRSFQLRCEGLARDRRPKDHSVTWPRSVQCHEMMIDINDQSDVLKGLGWNVPTCPNLVIRPPESAGQRALKVRLDFARSYFGPARANIKHTAYTANPRTIRTTQSAADWCHGCHDGRTIWFRPRRRRLNPAYSCLL